MPPTLMVTSATFEQIAPAAACPRRIRVAAGVYQRVSMSSGQPVPGKYEFVVRDAARHQHWQTARGTTPEVAAAERAEAIVRLAHGLSLRPPAATPPVAQRVEATPSPSLPQSVEPANLTVSDVARAWLERARGGRGEWARSTRERYACLVRSHIDRSADPDRPPLGACPLHELTVDAVAEWSAANERVLAQSTALIALIALKQICRYAVRRGYLAENPVAGLEPGERPRRTSGRVGVLEGNELATVLSHAGSYRRLFEFLAFTGLRIGEALGLTWADVDFEYNILRVHRQLSRYRVHARLKTDAAAREVILAPAIVRILRNHWLTSPFKGADDFVFATTTRRGLDYRRVGNAFRYAVRRAGLTGRGRLSLHSLRHGYASLLIAEGLDVVFVSRQLGHANANVTLSVYAHLFARASYATAARQAVEASYAAMAQGRS